MIAIALLALLLLIGLPTFSTMISNLRVRSVSDGVLSGVQFARTEALKRNLNMTLQLDPVSGVGGGWRVFPTNDTTNILESKSATEGNAVLVSLTAGATELVFNNLGRRIQPVVTNGTGVVDIDISNPGVGSCESSGGSVRCLRITVAIGGEARLCDPSRPTGDPQAC
jgi:type IV fimbrial biogenesis protein FimT